MVVEDRIADDMAAIFKYSYVGLKWHVAACVAGQTFYCLNEFIVSAHAVNTIWAVAFDVSSVRLTVTLVADSYNTTATVTQNGVQKLNVSCRGITGNDSRCGDTAGNVGLADAWVAFVAGDAPVMQGYTVGATSFSLAHRR